MTKLEITLYRNESPRAEALEQSIQSRGYEVKTILTANPQPAISAGTFVVSGYRDISACLGLI